jgi:hypothetical protein
MNYSSLVSRLCLPLIFLLISQAGARGAAIMVNEYKNTGGNADGTKMVTDEYIEFVLTENLTATALAGFVFGDSNAATSSLISAFQFDLTTLNSVLSAAGRSDFLAGTIIVVKGTALGPEDLSYNPNAGNVTDDAAWNIQLVSGLGAKGHPTTSINGSIDIAGTGDVIWIASSLPSSSTDTSGFIHALGHDTSPGAIGTAVTSQFGAASLLGSNITSSQSVYNTAGALVSLTNSTSGTMGTVNTTDNSIWIQNELRITALGVPEPSRAMIVLVALTAMTTCRKRRW